MNALEMQTIAMLARRRGVIITLVPEGFHLYQRIAGVEAASIISYTEAIQAVAPDLLFAERMSLRNMR